MKTAKVVVSLCALGLVACSGGRSSDMSEQPKEKMLYSENSPLVETIITVPKAANKETEIDTHTYLTTSYFRAIEIDGKEVDIFQNKDSKFIDIDDENIHHYAKQHNNTLVGIIHHREKDDSFYVFTQAINPTKNMPVVGVSHYSGIAIHGYDSTGKGGVENHFTDAKANFIVDFNEKTIKGTIAAYNKQFNSVNLEGKIKQNYFIGYKNGMKLEGGFFGKNADEISGKYLTKDSAKDMVSGVFAAEKQER